ncbi:MAG: glycerophosphodiester phosphodiesterase family protein [Thermodesulfovibrionia bacterium]|nr:glycerophosphodiester phosphodiesterase family protein [Thermodesulfovibrionia bacterium]
MTKEFLKIGHRGACGYEPENTLLSFKKAIELNVDMIELDVHVCKTGEVVVIHDDKVDRTTDGKGYVAKKTFQKIRTLDAGKGQKIPILQEVLDMVDRKAKINIELKGKGTAKPVFGIIEKYVKEKRWSYDDFLISSFNRHELQKFYQLNPKVRLGILIARPTTRFERFAKKINAYSVNARIDLVNKDFINNVRKKRLKVFVWTVNDFKDIERMKLLEVDGIFSDFPDRL